jgi:hypothetical protein
MPRILTAAAGMQSGGVISATTPELGHYPIGGCFPPAKAITIEPGAKAPPFPR